MSTAAEGSSAPQPSPSTTRADASQPSPKGDGSVPSTSTGAVTQSVPDSEEVATLDGQGHFELLHVVEQFLTGIGFNTTAESMRREIQNRGLVPPRLDFTGVAHARTYRQYLAALSSLPSTSAPTPELLTTMVGRLAVLADRSVPASTPRLPLRLVVNQRNAPTRTSAVLQPPSDGRLLMGPRATLARTKVGRSPLEILRARELGCYVPRARLPGPAQMESFERHFRINGHGGDVFCVLFDRTGNFLITGSDDGLIKVWSVRGTLRYTFRGHGNKIADLSVSPCNRFLASGDLNSCVRVWCLQKGTSLAYFRHHSQIVTSVNFLPFAADGDPLRYLVTTSSDCSIIFYQYTDGEDPKFPQQPTYRWHERDVPNAKMLTICYSPGGHIVAAGESHGALRIYRVGQEGVSKMADIVAHSDKVDSLESSHTGIALASAGSKDGLVKIWRYEYGEWTPTVLSLTTEELYEIAGNDGGTLKSKKVYTVTMLRFTIDDGHLLSLGSDCALRVWNAKTGAPIRKMRAHADTPFHLLIHPVHASIVVTAGNDGCIFMWDISAGRVLKKWENKQGQDTADILDAVICGDGLRFALTDNTGAVSCFGLGTNDEAKKMPRVQFFSSDFCSVNIDERSGLLSDEVTGLAPELVAPPLLVGIDGNPLSEELQRLVPGREAAQTDAEELKCAWLHRDIVASMPGHDIKRFNDDAAALLKREAGEVEEAMRRERPEASPEVEAIVPYSHARSRGLVRRAANRPPALRRFFIRQQEYLAPLNGFPHVGIIPVPRRRLEPDIALPEAENEEDEEGAGTAESAADVFVQDSTDTSDTDYSGDNDRARRRDDMFLARSYGGGTRRRRRERERERERASPADGAEEEEDGEGEGPSNQAETRAERRRRRRRDDNDDFGNDLSIDMHDLPPALITSATTGRRKKAPKRERESRQGSIDEGEAADGEERVQVERPPRAPPRRKTKEAATFPTSMKLDRPRRFPYFAQLGDNIVYCKQGHRNYLNEVMRVKLYHVTDKCWPRRFHEFEAEEYAIVDEVKYISPSDRSGPGFRLTCIKLAQTDSTGARTGHKYSIKYHDMENVPDFIVLRQHFDQAVSAAFGEGDEIESVIDEKWWTGTVQAIQPLEEEHPNSRWSSLTVRWSTGEDESVSPWDVRHKQRGRQSSSAPTEADVAGLGTYHAEAGDWPPLADGRPESNPGERLRHRLVTAISELFTVADVKDFSSPVSLADFPQYPEFVAYGIDLGTIQQRIEHGFYRRLRALQQDVRFIAIAAEQFNQANSVIVRDSRVLVETVIRYSNDPSIHNVIALFKELDDGPDDELKEYNKKQAVRHEHDPAVKALLATTMGEAEGEEGAEEREGRRKMTGWEMECQAALQEVMDSSCAEHFISMEHDQDHNLVAVWDACGDLSSILADLQESGKFRCPKEVEEAVVTLAQSVRTAIENKRHPVYKDATSLDQAIKRRLKDSITKFETYRANVNADLERHGYQLANGRSLRERKGGATAPYHHRYSTRRADAADLSRVAAAEAAEKERVAVEASSYSSSGRHLSHPQGPGYYKHILSGRGGGGYEERRRTAASTSTAMAPSTSRPSRRAANGRNFSDEMEGGEEGTSPSPPPKRRPPPPANGKRRVKVEEDDEVGEQWGLDPEAEESDNETVKEEPDDDYEEESPRHGRGGKKSGDGGGGGRKSGGNAPSSQTAKRRRVKSENTDDDEYGGVPSPASSLETASSSRRRGGAATRNGGGTRKRAKIEEEADEDEPGPSHRSMRAARATRREEPSHSHRPVRAAAANRTRYDEEDDEEDDEEFDGRTLAARRRVRKPVSYA